MDLVGLDTDVLFCFFQFVIPIKRFKLEIRLEKIDTDASTSVSYPTQYALFKNLEDPVIVENQ